MASARVLAIVVAHDEPRDLVAHGLQQRVPIVDGELAGRDDAVEEHLQVDLVVRHVDARAVVDRIRVDEAARERELDATALGEPEVAALADDAASQLEAVDADGVVRLVADVGIAFGARLDERADAAVPQEVDGRTQQARDHLVRRQGATSSGMPSRLRTSGVIAMALAVRG